MWEGKVEEQGKMGTKRHGLSIETEGERHTKDKRGIE